MERLLRAASFWGAAARAAARLAGQVDLSANKDLWSRDCLEQIVLGLGDGFLPQLAVLRLPVEWAQAGRGSGGSGGARHPRRGERVMLDGAASQARGKDTAEGPSREETRGTEH